jgi:phosphoribosylanthranilate isomerase
MVDGIQFKVCGLRSVADAECAAECGADYLGFNFYPASPRAVSPPEFQAIAKQLPGRPKVAVTVEPSRDELSALRDAGFDALQIHFRSDLPLAQIAAWSEFVGPERLWLAPKLPPSDDVPTAWLPLARTWMLDTYQPEKFGGTGRVGDWGKFSRHHLAYGEKNWLLAGGLSPENIGAALRESGARFVDVNSGVESAPGVKDHAKLRAFSAAVRSTAALAGDRQRT